MQAGVPVMDIRQLKYFLAVVDHNGFSRAAEHLLVAQPSLSQAIAGFERELGMPLFHRIGRGVVLSEAGAVLVGPARVVVRDLDEAKATMAALKGLRGGRIDLVTMPSPGMEPLTTILTAFSRAHPDVTVNAEAAFTPEEVLALVRTGSAEVGILGSAEPTVAADLDVVSLEHQALVLIRARTTTADGGSISRDLPVAGSSCPNVDRSCARSSTTSSPAESKSASSPKSPIALRFCRWSSRGSGVP